MINFKIKFCLLLIIISSLGLGIILCYIIYKSYKQNYNKNRYAYYNPTGHILEEYADKIPKVGDILRSYYNGIVIKVNIHGKRKGSITNHGIPYALQKIEPNSRNLTYIYYDYIVKTDKQNPEYKKLYEESWGKKKNY